MWAWIITGLVGYVVGGWLTFEFNAYLVRDMAMVKGRIVARNVLLWPVFLPLLIRSMWR